jgi:hypothetical protein
MSPALPWPRSCHTPIGITWRPATLSIPSARLPLRPLPQSAELAGTWRPDRFRPVAEGASYQLDRFESQGGIESDRVRFCIHHHADTTGSVPHLQGHLEDSPQQQPADAMAVEPLVHCQPGDAQDGFRLDAFARSARSLSIDRLRWR